jgi:hypothetical protein
MIDTFKFIGDDTVLPLNERATITLRKGQIMALDVRSDVGWYHRHVSKWRVQIYAPFFCPYSSWATFYQNWKLVTDVIDGDDLKEESA